MITCTPYFASASDMPRARTSFTSRLDLTLEEIFPLPTGQKRFYWFDFGE
jgi:hypothetical protein